MASQSWSYETDAYHRNQKTEELRGTPVSRGNTIWTAVGAMISQCGKVTVYVQSTEI